jgi:peptide subunit release factor RF-3
LLSSFWSPAQPRARAFSLARSQDRPVLLVKNQWALQNIKEKYPDVELLTVAPLG